MIVIKARNAHEALPEGLRLLRERGLRRESRNGTVLVAPEPVTTLYHRPEERVVFWPDRDCNPFFHLMESLWMLHGRNDVEFLTRFVGRMSDYSDDGETFHGAYGYRWRQHFQSIDQLPLIIKELKNNPDSRRCVLQMWDARVDLGRRGKDLPCNTQVFFSRRGDGALDMTVCNRSNDIIWGAYGANAVHFSILQEYIARFIGCPIGSYWQTSNNYHAYLETYEPLAPLADQARCIYSNRRNPYEHIRPFSIKTVSNAEWELDLDTFMNYPNSDKFHDVFFSRVVRPMYCAHEAWKDRKKEPEERFALATEILQQCVAEDWRIAAEGWLERRLEKILRSKDDGVLHVVR